MSFTEKDEKYLRRNHDEVTLEVRDRINVLEEAFILMHKYIDKKIEEVIKEK